MNLYIPRIFHRVWLGGKPMPEEFVQFGQSWLTHHPGWEMREWNEGNLPPLSTGELVQEARNFSQASDVIRYELLLKFGGVYLDTDFLCQANTESLLCNFTFVGAGERPDMVSAGFIASTPNHPLIREVLRILPARLRSDLPQAQATGPGLLSEVWRPYRDMPGVKAYGPEMFYPYSFREKHRRHESFPNAVAVHHWAGSWVEPG